MKILLLGLPGAGKGVQGKNIASCFGISHVSIGDVVRDVLATDSLLAREIRASFSGARWQPLPDVLAAQVAVHAVSGLQSFVLDGFPRNVRQAELAVCLGSLDVGIFLNASEEECRSRVLARKRDGDSAEKIEARLVAERERLPQLVDYLRSQLPLIEVDADQEPEVVFQSIRSALGRVT